MAELGQNFTLNNLTNEQAGGKDYEITGFTYSSKDVLKVIKKNLEATNFNGVSVQLLIITLHV